MTSRRSHLGPRMRAVSLAGGWLVAAIALSDMASAEGPSASERKVILQVSEARCREGILQLGGGVGIAHLGAQVRADCAALGMSEEGLECLKRQWLSVILLGYGSDEPSLAILLGALAAEDVIVRKHAVLALIARGHESEALEAARELLSTGLNRVHLGLIVARFDDHGIHYVLRAASRGMAAGFENPVSDLLAHIRNEPAWVPLVRGAIEGQANRQPGSTGPAQWLGVLLDGVDAEWAENRLRLMAVAAEDEGVRRRAHDLLISRPRGRGGDLE